ncbi:MAG: DUF3034 family protein [Aestuariibacter sp.]
MRRLIQTILCTMIFSITSVTADTGSSLLATGGITGFEGAAGGGITPWATIGGYGSREEINGTASIQTLQLGEYQLTTVGALIGFYDRVELSVQRQTLDISSGITSNVFNLLTAGEINTAPGTEIEQDVVGLKVKLFGDLVFSKSAWEPQISAGIQYKNNRDFATSLPLSDGTVPLPNLGVPAILGAKKDSGTDIYISASKFWLGGAMGNNLLLNLTARATKANTFGLLGFEAENDNDFDLELEGSMVLLPSVNTAVGVEWRTQSDRLGGLAKEETVYDFFVAWLPDKSWSMTLAYVDLGSLPFEPDANGFYLSVTGNW